MGCATTLSTADKRGLVRESVLAADEAFTTWYTSKQEAATTPEEVTKLVSIRERWDIVLDSLREGLRELGNEGESSALEAARASAKEFLRQVGIATPEGL